MKTIYIITEYRVKDAVLHIHKAVDFDEIIEIQKNYADKISSVSGILNGERKTIESNRHHSLSTKPKGQPEGEKFLPFTSDIVEDLPGSIKLEPRVYKNCNLMTEKHGLNLQFYYPPEKKVLRIAMNSHVWID